MICEGKSVAEIVAVGSEWPARIAFMQPTNIVELGTGQGCAGARIMSALPPNATFTTINYNYPIPERDIDRFGRELDPWNGDSRLKRLIANTIDPTTLDKVPDNIDILFIDSTHEAWHAAAELRLWQRKLQDGAIVIVDDLDQNDMSSFWESLPYERLPLGAGCYQGTFRYNASRPYAMEFSRPSKTSYGGNI